MKKDVQRWNRTSLQLQVAAARCEGVQQPSPREPVRSAPSSLTLRHWRAALLRRWRSAEQGLADRLSVGHIQPAARFVWPVS